MIGDSETFIINDRSKTLMEKLRSEILKNFRWIWLYLYKEKDGGYAISAANQEGSKLTKDEISAVKRFATDFMLDPRNKDDFLKF
jgi:hypothetical protein